jgi:parvulin-like peptidyl-prolyl isomerase
MKARFSLLLLVVTLPARAQVASHAPTTMSTSAPSASVSTLSAPKPIVRVNGTVLTDRDLLREMFNVFPYAKQHGGRFPKESEPQIRQTALKNIEFEELAYQTAVKKGMTVSPEKLSKALKDFRKQFDTEADYQEFLKVENKGSEQELRKSIRRAILIDQYLKLEIDNKARLTDAQTRAIYDKNPNHFRKPDSVWLQTITIAYGQTPSPAEKQDARKKAEDALKQARATKDYEGFGLVAEKVSMDDWHVMMGDHKWLHRGRMPEAVEKVVFALKVGQISDIIDAGDSFCIARVNGREDTHLVPFDQVKDRLKKDTEEDRSKVLRAALEKSLRANAKIDEL